MELDSTTLLMLVLFIFGLVLLFAALAKKQAGPLKGLNPILAGVLGVILIIPGFFYGVMPMLPAEETETPTETVVVVTDDEEGIACTFDVNIYANGTADTFDNTTTDSPTGNSFTTPYVRNSTGTTRTIHGTASTAALNVNFHDPIYNFSVMPIAPTGVTADDLVTLKFSAVDPGENIHVSGVDYRMVAQDSDNDAYLYWKCVDASSGATLTDWTPETGSATFLYTDRVYLWLNVVYQDDGLARLSVYDSESLTATLSNIDGSWSESFTITTFCVGTHT